MIFGFNTDVRVGNTVYHVQTEDRGLGNPVIDTTIYVKGRVLARRATSYKELLNSPHFREADLQGILEQQHKLLIEEIRSGALPELAQLPLPILPSSISVQLVNPATFLRGTTATLQVAVVSRPNGEPVRGAQVRILVATGAGQPVQLDATTEKDGIARVQFPLPRLGPGGTELLIQASAPQGRDEIKYNMRPKLKE